MVGEISFEQFVGFTCRRTLRLSKKPQSLIRTILGVSHLLTPENKCEIFKGFPVGFGEDLALCGIQPLSVINGDWFNLYTKSYKAV